MSTIIIGSGLAGLSVALKLAEKNKEIIIISKKISKSYKFNYSSEIEINKSLVDNFYKSYDSCLSICLDLYKYETNILTAYYDKVKEYKNVKFIEDFVIDLIIDDNKCNGVKTLTHDLKTSYIYSKNVVICTGGINDIHNSSYNEKTGDGLAMAVRAGLELYNMKSVITYPFQVDDIYNPIIIPETVKFEGAYLLNNKMNRFTSSEFLTSNDRLSTCIQNELNKNNKVYLDIRHIYNYKLKYPELLIYDGLIPIKPCVYLLCGGIKVDVNGKTNINDLYASGECTAYGYTGTNGDDIVSNSYLQCIQSSDYISKDICKYDIHNINSTPRLQNIVKDNSEFIGVLENTSEFCKELTDAIYSNNTSTLKSLRNIINSEIFLFDESYDNSISTLQLFNALEISKYLI